VGAKRRRKQMRHSGKGSGGGQGMNKNVKQTVRTGAPKRAVNPGGAGQIGASQGDHVTEKRQGSGYRGEKLFAGTGYPSKLGNEVAASTTCGPGGSREVMRSGSQGTHGAPNPGSPRPKGPDIFTEFPPDLKR
jgi:hypothetical protein